MLLWCISGSNDGELFFLSVVPSYSSLILLLLQLIKQHLKTNPKCSWKLGKLLKCSKKCVVGSGQPPERSVFSLQLSAFLSLPLLREVFNLDILLSIDKSSQPKRFNFSLIYFQTMLYSATSLRLYCWDKSRKLQLLLQEDETEMIHQDAAVADSLIRNKENVSFARQHG